MTPKRIALIGNGGCGKSTIAKRLARTFELPLHIVDDIQFLPGWERAGLEKVQQWHERTMRSDEWIVDGWGSLELLKIRFTKAELVLLFDYPLEVCLESARKREGQSAAGLCAYEPPGCRYADVHELMDATLRRVDTELMPQIRSMLAPHEAKTITLSGFEDLAPGGKLEASLGRPLSPL